jgi:hypothetical protein
MTIKFKDEIDFQTFDNLVEEDADVVCDLSCLASNIKKKLLGFWKKKIPFQRNMKKNSYNMFFF